MGKYFVQGILFLCLIATSAISCFAQSSVVDSSFNPVNVPDYVTRIQISDTGKIYLNGTKSYYSDGTEVAGYNSVLLGSDFFYANIYGMKWAPNDKLLLFGSFYHKTLGGGQIIQLNSDGSIDTAFGFRAFTGSSNLVLGVDVDAATNRLAVGGSFYYSAPNFQQCVGLSTLAGVPVASFQSYPGVSSGFARAVAFSSGKIIAGGPIYSVNNLASGAIARFNMDGSADTSFSSNIVGDIEIVKPLASGKILVSGMVSGKGLLARLNSNGSTDTSFSQVEFLGSSPSSIVVEQNGTIWAAGSFGFVNGATQKGLARFTPDGVPEPSFLTSNGLQGAAALALQSDGKLIIGGHFSSAFGVAKANLVRISTTLSAPQKQNPTVTWNTPSAIFYGTPLSGSVLNASANVAGSFSYTPALGAVLNAGTQTLSVTFDPTDSSNYNSVSRTVSLLVNKVTPNISWTSPSAISYGTSLSSTQLNAASAVSGTFSYSPASGTVLDAGIQTLSVTFTPTNTGNYNSATGSVQIAVNKVTPTLVWGTPGAIVFGNVLSGLQLNAQSNVPGTYTYSPAQGILLAAGTHTLQVSFSPTASNNYNSVSKSVSLVINKATPVIAWNNPGAIVVGTALSASQLNATSSVGGTYTYSPSLGTLLSVGSHFLNLNFSPSDNSNYTTATKSVSIQVIGVNAVSPILQWGPVESINSGIALSAAQLKATANVAGTFSYSPALGSVLPVGTHTLTANFTPTDLVNYKTASITTTLVVKAIVVTPSPIATGTMTTAPTGTATRTPSPTATLTPTALVPTLLPTIVPTIAPTAIPALPDLSRVPVGLNATLVGRALTLSAPIFSDSKVHYQFFVRSYPQKKLLNAKNSKKAKLSLKIAKTKKVLASYKVCVLKKCSKESRRSTVINSITQSR